MPQKYRCNSKRVIEKSYMDVIVNYRKKFDMIIDVRAIAIWHFDIVLSSLKKTFLAS